jgi:dTDP-glucose 4,6-dehydratase
MKLIVTGGAGFIGSEYVAQRISAGDEVVVIDALTYAGHRANLDWIQHNGKLELVVGNICDAVLVEKTFSRVKPDAIIHFAAESHVDNSITSPGEFLQTNIMGSYTLLEAARKYFNKLSESAKSKFRFVQVSTDEVYGSLGETGYFTEESRYEPNSPYSASKAAGDMLARAWNHTYDLPTIITNCSNNYGQRQFPEKLIPLTITHALSGETLPVYGDGKNIRDWIFVGDHAAGVHLALTKGKIGEVYCFGGRAEKQNIEVVKTICKILDELKPRKDGKPYAEQITFVKDRLGHDRRYAIDDSKAEQELGFRHSYDFEAGIRHTIKWYLDNQDWCKEVMGNKKAA